MSTRTKCDMRVSLSAYVEALWIIKLTGIMVCRSEVADYFVVFGDLLITQLGVLGGGAAHINDRANAT